MRGTCRRYDRSAPGKNPRTRFYLAFAYLLWSLVPHFHLLIHSHAGGAHSHAALTGAQVRLANRVLDGIGPAGLARTADTQTGGVESPVPRAPGEATLAADAAGVPHAHFWEDANLAGAASLPAFAWMGAALLPYSFIRYASPTLSARGIAPARGPPAFLTA